MAENKLTAKQIALTKGARVLVVDDNTDLLRLISLRLKPLKFDLKTAESGYEALSLMTIWAPDLIITDMQMPNFDGFEFFETVHSQNPLVPVIILTAHGTIADAVKAAQAGVASFLTKPFNGDQLIVELQQVLLNSGFAEQLSVGFEAAANERSSELRNIASKSPKMAALMQQIERLAPTDAMLLFEGEAGSGKDELVRAAHRLSGRAKQTLMHVSGAALPDELLSIELFGKVGNGTPDDPDRLGILREADGGTLFLSDFNEASRTLIFKVLTALVAKHAKPVDSDYQYSFDIRFICSTALVGKYGRNSRRSWDFWNKLGINLLSVPALRERREDIPLIVNQCLERLDEDNSDKSITQLSLANKALQQILSNQWPGNVRQLTSVVRQCARLCRTKVVSAALVKSRLTNPTFQTQSLSSAHRDFERNYVTEVLKATNGNVTLASAMAKRNRTEFHRLLNKHKIEAKSFRQ
ncbi:MAG: two-component system response regulator GlrR [Arenicella sp.]|jgi:two-component system response regulator GlrR